MRTAVIFAIWVLWLMVSAGPPGYCAKESRK